MVAAGAGLVAFPSQRGHAVTLHASGAGAVQRQPAEKLGRHAAAAAAVEVSAAAARSGRVRLAQLDEQRGVLPYIVEAAVGHDVSGEEPVVDGERARVDVTD